MKILKALRLADSKKGTYKEGEIYDAVLIGENTIKVKVDNVWRYAKKDNFIILED